MLTRLRLAFGLALLLAGFVVAMPEASPHADGIAGIAQRGPAAQLRSRIDRARALLGEGQPMEAQAAAESLLTELRTRYGTLSELLADNVLTDAAREAAGVRADAILAVDPPRTGFREAFLRTVAAGATYADWSLGVPASVTIAQAVLESDWGRSAPGYNMFGLKGEGSNGSTVSRVIEYRGGQRRTKMAAFRAYFSLDESLLDHGKILAASRYYARARAVGDDPDAFARALQGVYATDPRYARKLSKLMDDLGLRRFDWRDVTAPIEEAAPRAVDAVASLAGPIVLSSN